MKVSIYRKGEEVNGHLSLSATGELKSISLGTDGMWASLIDCVNGPPQQAFSLDHYMIRPEEGPSGDKAYQFGLPLEPTT